MKVRIIKACTVNDERQKAGSVVDVSGMTGAKLIARGLASADLKSKAKPTEDE